MYRNGSDTMLLGTVPLMDKLFQSFIVKRQFEFVAFSLS